MLDVDDLAGVRADELVLSSAYPPLRVELAAALRGGDLPLVQFPSGPFDELVNWLLATIADRQAEGLRPAA